MERNDVIRKIKKLMAIAHDESASDTEIQLAVTRANRLMLEYKIHNADLFEGRNHTVDDVIKYTLQERGCGYIYRVLKVVAEYFQCRIAFVGKINSNCGFVLYGLRKDIELCAPVVESVVYYLEKMLIDLKECYLESVDFRIYKRNYLTGFAYGLNEQLWNDLKQLNMTTKNELAIVSVPKIVDDVVRQDAVEVTSKPRKSDEGFDLGKKHGREFEMKRTNLLRG